MNCDSDIYFPLDTGLPKLSSPLHMKLPEIHDWAFDEFIQTLKDKPFTDAENLLSFKQYTPVEEEQDFMDFEKLELHEILKGGFTLIQANSKPKEIQVEQWLNETIDYKKKNATDIIVSPAINHQTTSVQPHTKPKKFKAFNNVLKNTKKFFQKILTVSS